MKNIINFFFYFCAILAIASCTVDEMDEPMGSLNGYACLEDGTPVSGGVVEMVGTDRKAICNEIGEFYFFHVPAGDYTLKMTLEDGTALEGNAPVRSDMMMPCVLTRTYPDFPIVAESVEVLTATYEYDRYRVRLTNTSDQNVTIRLTSDGELLLEKGVGTASWVTKEIDINGNLEIEAQKSYLIYCQNAKDSYDKRMLFMEWNGKKQAVHICRYTD